MKPTAQRVRKSAIDDVGRVRKLLIFTVAALLSCASTVFGQNRLVNGGFETGDYPGWTAGGNFELTQVVSGPFYVYNGAQEGQYYSTLAPAGAAGMLSQSFNDTAGAYYVVSFWLAAAAHCSHQSSSQRLARPRNQRADSIRQDVN